MANYGILGKLRGAARTFISADNQQLIYGDGGELIVNAGLPPETELARTGAGAYAFATTTGVAATQTIPTTAACTTLFNNNGNGSGICYVVAACGATVYTGSATQGPSAYSLLVRNDVPGQNSMVTAASTIVSATDGRLYGGVGVAKQNVTLSAISAANNTAWIPAGSSQIWGATASLGSFYGLSLWAETYGRWIVRPQGVFSLSVLGGVAASNLSFVGGFIWYEVKFSGA